MRVETDTLWCWTCRAEHLHIYKRGDLWKCIRCHTSGVFQDATKRLHARAREVVVVVAPPPKSPPEVSVCPYCNGLKSIPDPLWKHIRLCPLCRGIGCVDVNEKCWCGLPAVLVLEGTPDLYCGNKVCAGRIRGKSVSEENYNSWKEYPLC